MDREIVIILNQILKNQAILTKRMDTNSLILETLKADIKTLAEVQRSSMEQIESKHQELITLIENKSAILENAIRHLSNQSDSTSKAEVIQLLSRKSV